MPQQFQEESEAGGCLPDQAEWLREQKLGVQAFAARYVLIGSEGARVRVRRKSDGVEGTLAYHIRPLMFGDFMLASGGSRR